MVTIIYGSYEPNTTKKLVYLIQIKLSIISFSKRFLRIGVFAVRCSGKAYFS